MAYLLSDCPHIFCFLRERFLYQMDPSKTGFVEGAVVAVRSQGDRALGFHFMTSFGALYGPVPLHALCWKKDAPEQPLYALETWDCYGETFTVTKLITLAELGVMALLQTDAGLERFPGTYEFTLDWCRNPYSDEPTQRKDAHIVRLDNGNFAAVPNNRALWYGDSMITHPVAAGGEIPPLKVIDRVWVSERGQEADESDLYFYGVGKKHVERGD